MRRRREVLTTTIEPRIIAILKSEAKRKNTSLSRLVEDILRAYLEERGALSHEE